MRLVVFTKPKNDGSHGKWIITGLGMSGALVGTVQQEIRKGMSGAEVAAVLGSPNIVSTDEAGREVLVYDKISSDVVYSTSGFIVDVGSRSTSQRTSRSSSSSMRRIRFAIMPTTPHDSKKGAAP